MILLSFFWYEVLLEALQRTPIDFPSKIKIYVKNQSPNSPLNPLDLTSNRYSINFDVYRFKTIGFLFFFHASTQRNLIGGHDGA
jgi:hypothetical protein